MDWTWVQNNWFTVAVVLFGAASEVIGMSPLKDNSVVQLLLRILGGIFKKKDV